MTQVSKSQLEKHPQSQINNHISKNQVCLKSQICNPISKTAEPLNKDSNGSLNNGNANTPNFQCPICLMVFISPVTLPCGHTYCQSCIKHSHFRHYLKKKCPICRKKIQIGFELFSVNLLLQQVILEKHQKDEKYMQRCQALQKSLKENKNSKSHTLLKLYRLFKDWLSRSYPWIIIILLIYHLIRVKISVFYMLMEKYKDKALSIAEEIKKENSLDFKFLLFSQFMRILFSNIAIP